MDREITLFTPLITAWRWRQSKNYRLADYGMEKRCGKCPDWWPADTEFFYTHSRDGLHNWCRACYQEWRQSKRGNGASTTDQQAVFLRAVRDRTQQRGRGGRDGSTGGAHDARCAERIGEGNNSGRQAIHDQGDA